MSALLTGRPLLPEVRLEGLGQLKNVMTLQEVEHTTSCIVAQCLNRSLAKRYKRLQEPAV
jgi:hypothetical protein